MHAHDLELPKLLVELIDRATWPRSDEEVRMQNLEPMLGKEAARRLSPDDDHILLMSPPFHTISDEVTHGNDFWSKWLTNVGEIDYSRAVIVADFGLGSDSPIILYYADASPTPVVMYLKWTLTGRAATQAWVQTHDSFEQFAEDAGLLSSNIPHFDRP